MDNRLVWNEARFCFVQERDKNLGGNSLTLTPGTSDAGCAALDLDSLGRPVCGTSPLPAASLFRIVGESRSACVEVLPVTGFARVVSCPA